MDTALARAGAAAGPTLLAEVAGVLEGLTKWKSGYAGQAGSPGRPAGRAGRLAGRAG